MYIPVNPSLPSRHWTFCHPQMSFVRLYSRDLNYNSLVLIFLEIAEEPPGRTALERRLTNNRHFPLPYHSVFTLSLGAPLRQRLDVPYPEPRFVGLDSDQFCFHWYQNIKAKGVAFNCNLEEVLIVTTKFLLCASLWIRCFTCIFISCEGSLNPV